MLPTMDTQNWCHISYQNIVTCTKLTTKEGRLDQKYLILFSHLNMSCFARTPLILSSMCGNREVVSSILSHSQKTKSQLITAADQVSNKFLTPENNKNDWKYLEKYDGALTRSEVGPSAACRGPTEGGLQREHDGAQAGPQPPDDGHRGGQPRHGGAAAPVGGRDQLPDRPRGHGGVCGPGHGSRPRGPAHREVLSSLGTLRPRCSGQS